jgi:hypothetical protein
LVRSLLIQVSPSIGDENQFPIPRRLQDTYVQPPGGLWTNTLQVNTGTYLYAYQPLGVPLGWYLANVTVDNEFLMTWPLFAPYGGWNISIPISPSLETGMHDFCVAYNPSFTPPVTWRVCLSVFVCSQTCVAVEAPSRNYVLLYCTSCPPTLGFVLEFGEVYTTITVALSPPADFFLTLTGDGYQPGEMVGFYVDTIGTMILPPSTGVVADSTGHLAFTAVPLPSTLSVGLHTVYGFGGSLGTTRGSATFTVVPL